MTDSFEAYIDKLIGEEGKYSDDPHDAGGATAWGITEAVARANGYTGDMRLMRQADASVIYQAEYWQRAGFVLIDPLSPAVATKLLDAGVNEGVGTVSLFLQRALNVLHPAEPVARDGHVGPGTAKALADYLAARPGDGESIMLKAINCLQGARYIALAEASPNDLDYVNGWLKARVA